MTLAWRQLHAGILPISLKKRKEKLCLLSKKEKKFSWRFIVSRTRKRAYSPQLLIFDNIPIPSVLRSKKRGVMFSPQFLKVNFFNSLFHLFYEIIFFWKDFDSCWHLSDDKTPPPSRTHGSQHLAQCQTLPNVCGVLLSQLWSTYMFATWLAKMSAELL